jgi:hypothetical protein
MMVSAIASQIKFLAREKRHLLFATAREDTRDLSLPCVDPGVTFVAGRLHGTEVSTRSRSGKNEPDYKRVGVVTHIGEPLATNLARMWLLAGVNPFMHFQGAMLYERLSTSLVGTDVVPLARVCLHVAGKVRIAREGLQGKSVRDSSSARAIGRSALRMEGGRWAERRLQVVKDSANVPCHTADHPCPGSRCIEIGGRPCWAGAGAGRWPPSLTSHPSLT